MPDFADNQAIASAAPLRHALEQLACALEQLDDATYARDRAEHLGASVGRHVRHCLDHVQQLIEAIATGELNYDARARGTTLEHQPAKALAQISDLVAALDKLKREDETKPLRMSAIVDADLPPARFETTLGRELVFVLNHTVHHFAMIRAMLEPDGHTLPPHFGFAPATVQNQKADQSCVR